MTTYPTPASNTLETAMGNLTQAFAAREVAFIDSSIVDYETLSDTMPPGIETVILDGRRDGLSQIAAWSARHSGYAAIHVLSHGGPGLWMLGNADLDSAALDARATELAALGRALATGGELLIYGCSIGAEPAFVEKLAALTGAAVAASAVPTGAAALGGHWKLDVTAGTVGTTAFAVERFAGLLGVDITFDFESDTTPAQDDTGATAAATVTQLKSGETISVAATGGKLVVADEGPFLGGDLASLTDTTVAFDMMDAYASTQIRVSLESDSTFNLTTLGILDNYNLEYSPETLTLVSSSGATYDVSAQINYGGTDNGNAIINVSALSGFQNITYFDVYANGANMQVALDNIALTNITPPGPQLSSATYDASTGVLTVTVATATGTPMVTGNTIDVSKLTLTGEGGDTRVLTSANVTASSATGFSVTLNAADQAAVNQILNKAGTSSTGGTTYNLSGAADWNASVSTVADTTGNAVTVSNPTTPTITDATYDAATGTLVVTGTGFLKLNGATNDIDVSKLTFAGEGGSTRTLTSTSVEITSGTSFSVTLNAADLAAINLILNKNGTSSTGGTTYNLAAAEDWAAGAASAVVVADTTGNGITVSNVAVPAITSATYDASTGMLVVTGTGFLKLNGAANDIDASKLTFAGEGGSTRTLTSTSVEITSGTSFSVTLNAADLAAVNLILNKNGSSSTSGTAYNLAAAEDWAAGADAAVVVADLTGNGITVSNVAVPAITSATYDAATGVLTVTGTGFLKLNGATNDIDVSKLTLAGEGGDSHALTSGNVEITSGTSFSVTLNAADLAAVNQILNKTGTISTGGTTYNLAAAEDWAVGADAAVVVADLTGNGITVANPTTPTITGATYDYTTNTLVVTGIGFLKYIGASNDIDISKLGFTGAGGASYTLTSASDVELDSATQFTITLAGADLTNVEALLDKNGTSSTGGTTYNLAAAEDWSPGAASAVVIADTTGNGITVSNWNAPTLTSATYDIATGSLVLTGTNFVSTSGASNDIVANKLTLTGQDGASHTLTDTANVELTSATSATLTLSTADRLSIQGLLNKNGTSAGDGTTYNIAAADDWMPGSPVGIDIADATGNGITVANVASPTITSATYDSDSGSLSVTGTNLFSKPGAANDVVVSKLTLTGGTANATYTLTSASNVDISSATGFSITLSGADKTAVDALLDQLGTTSSGGSTYNLAAADDWLAAADATANIADATNAVTVSVTPRIASATYNAATGVLVVTGTNMQANGAALDVDVSKLTLTGEGGSTYTLTTAGVELDSVSQFTVALNATDKAAVNLILNKAGTTSTSGTTFNLAAADDWNTNLTAGDTSDATNGLNVSNPTSPTITDATYDASTGTLVVTGTGFLKLNGATNDIDVSKLTFAGEGGSTRTLTSTSVEITSGTSFSVTLNAADLAAVNLMLNKNGTSSTGGTTYNLAAAEDWAAGADAAVVVADTTGNGITVSNVAVPAITSATYDAATGVLTVTGTGFLKLNGATNDIDVSKLTLAGEGGSARTLTSTSVEITSGTSFSVTLNAADLAAVNLMLNKNGTSSTGGTTYNLAAAEDWAAGADAAVVVADTTGNGITVSNLAVPAITSATYDAATGVLTVTGTGFLKLNGATNDIDVSKLTLAGEGGSARTLTSTSVEITSDTSFSVTLNAADLAAVNLMLNKNGTSSTGGTTYNLAAAEDWAAGADAAVVVADTAGNGITVSNVAVPAITSATYDAATGVLTVTGTGFLKLNGATNDIDVSKLTLAGEGGSTRTLTSTSVEITNGTSFSVTLNAADLAAVNLILNKNGTASTSGTTYNLAAAEDWAAGADTAVVVADTTGNGITASNVAVPAITSATYNTGTGVLLVTGTGFLSLAGVTNDIDVSKLSITGQGGASHPLTSASVEITSATSFSVTLNPADKTAVDALLNKTGTSANDATVYNIAAAEDWAAGADAAATVADLAGNGITVTVYVAPAPAPDPGPAPTPTPAPVDDGDNVSTTTENLVPSLPPTSGGAAVAGDGNGDGVTDSAQANVTSLPFRQTDHISQNQNAPQTFITLVAGSDEGRATGAAQLASIAQQDRPADLPADFSSPLGQISFKATTPTAGATETFSLFIDASLAVNGYWKQDASGTWVNLATHLTRVGDKLRLDFAIQDGGQFDADGKADGVIIDPGALAYMPLSITGHAPDLPTDGFWF